MGIALIVPDISFADENLGKVTLTGNIPITGLSITGPDSAIGAADAATFVPAFTPINTTQRGVQWSVVSGSNYASIDNSTGALSILSGASGAPVTIRVTSLDNNTIFAEKTISVTYSGSGFIPLEDLTARINFAARASVFKTDIVPSVGDYFKVKVAAIGSSYGAFFGSRKLSTADDDSLMFERDNTRISYFSMRAKIYGTRYTSANEMAVGTRYTAIIKPDGVTVDPSLGDFTSSSYTFSQAYPIAIGTIALADNTVISNSMSLDFFGLEIYGSNDVLKHRLIPQSDLTFLDEVTGVSYSPTSTVGLIYADDV